MTPVRKVFAVCFWGCIFGPMIFAGINVLINNSRIKEGGPPLEASQPVPIPTPTPIRTPPPKPYTYIPGQNLILFGGFPRGEADGQLTISNGTSHHAIIKLWVAYPQRVKLLSFLVTSHASQVITRIPDGVYRVAFQLGNEIVSGTDHFWNPAGCSEFAQPLNFGTDRTISGVSYTTFELTLHPVRDGNAKTDPFPDASFDNL